MPDVFVSKSKSEEVPPIHATQPESSHGVNLFTTFCENPKDARFHSQDEDETLLLFLRAHFITNLSWIITTIALILLPVFLPWFLSVITVSLSSGQITIITIFYYLAVFTYAFINFITWYYNIGLITQKRAIDIDFSHLVYHDVAETKLSLVEDVNYTQSGFIRTFFNYGDLFIQTAGGKENIEFLAVPMPGKATKIVADLIGKGGHSG